MAVSEQRKYIPALRFDWLTPLYDPAVALTTRESTVKRNLVKQAQIEPGHRVLDLGCGTATLGILVKKKYARAEVVGMDADAKVLKIARAKVARAGVDISFTLAMAHQLPYPDHSFDRVLTSLLFHHLSRSDKQACLIEVRRVLRPGGEFHIADFGKPDNALARLSSFLFQLFEPAGDNFKGLIPIFMRRAGLEKVGEPARFMTIFGVISLYRGVKGR